MNDNDERNYNSRNGFVTYVWGPLLWSIIHIFALFYPDNPSMKEKQIYFEWILGLIMILPCGSCRRNLRMNLNILDFVKNKSEIMKNKGSFSKFTWKLHNHVNNQLNKHKNTDIYLDKFEQLRGETDKLKCLIEILPNQSKHSVIFDENYNDMYCVDKGFRPNVWGPMLWIVMHIISMNFPTSPSPEERRE